MDEYNMTTGGEGPTEAVFILALLSAVVVVLLFGWISYQTSSHQNAEEQMQACIMR